MAASTATLAHEGWQHKATASAAIPTGTLYITPEGNVAVFQGLKAAASGDQARYDNQNVYDITKGAVAFSEGDTVYLDASSNPATTGLIRVGRCTKTAASGDATVRVRLMRDNVMTRYASVAASTAVSNTVTETAFDTSVALPGSYLRAGDVLRIRGQAIATATNSTDTLTLKLYVGSLQIATTGAVDVANNDIGLIDADVVIRTAGASGTVVAAGLAGLGASATVTGKAFYLASASLDTTASNTIAIKATWSNASASNSCRLDVFNVQLIRS